MEQEWDAGGNEAHYYDDHVMEDDGARGGADDGAQGGAVAYNDDTPYFRPTGGVGRNPSFAMYKKTSQMIGFWKTEFTEFNKHLFAKGYKMITLVA